MANEVPTIQRTEKLETSNPVTGFANAARGMASASNIGSTLGAEVSIKAAAARAELAGIEYGKNPQGDLLPALTKVDEAFNNSYRNQAKATLSLQADKLLSSSLYAVNENEKLSPEIIGEFHSNVLQGMDQIVSQAPKQDQESLRNAITAQLIQSHDQLNTKYLQQQKQIAVDTHNEYISQLGEDLFNSGANGDDETSKYQRDEIVRSNNAMAEAGSISKTDAAKANDAAEISYFTSKYYHEYLNAAKNKNVAEFLSEFGKNPPAEMTPIQFVQVSKSLLGLISQKESLEARNQSLIMSEANFKTQMNSVTAADIKSWESDLDPDNFYKAMLNYSVQQQRQGEEVAALGQVYQNISNAGVLANVPEKYIEKAFAEQTQVQMQQNPGMTPFEAQTVVAASIAAPVPSFVRQVDGMATSGNPAQMSAAIAARGSAVATHPANMSGLSSEANHMLSMFEHAQPQGAVQAAETARKAVLEVDESKRKDREKQWQLISDKKFGTSTTDNGAGLIAGAFKVGGLSPTTTNNPVEYAIGVQKLFKANFLATGNESVAIKDTKEQIAKRYRESTANSINNRKKTENFPIDMALGASSQEMPIIHNMVAQQLKPYLYEFNAGSDVYEYNFLPTTSITKDAYDRATAELGDISKKLYVKGDNKSIFNFNQLDKKVADRIKILRHEMRGYENQDRPMLQRKDKQTGKTQNYYIGTTLDNDGSLNGSAIYKATLINMEGKTEGFLGVDASNLIGNAKGAFIKADKEQFDYHRYEFMKLSINGEKSAYDDMKETMQKKAAQERTYVMKKLVNDGFNEDNGTNQIEPSFFRSMREATRKNYERTGLPESVGVYNFAPKKNAKERDES